MTGTRATTRPSDARIVKDLRFAAAAFRQMADVLAKLDAFLPGVDGMSAGLPDMITVAERYDERAAEIEGAAVEVASFVIWASDHNAWWGENHRGYTPSINHAGRYTAAEVAEILVGDVLWEQFPRRAELVRFVDERPALRVQGER